MKLLAQAANATAIIKPQNRILVKLPYLVEIDRGKFRAELGEGVEVTRTAVELDPADELWRRRKSSWPNGKYSSVFEPPKRQVYLVCCRCRRHLIP